MRRNSRTPDGIPYGTEAELWVSGRWEGGTVEVRDHKLCRPPRLLRTQLFAVLAVLVIRSKLDKRLPAEKQWQNRGFVTAREIVSLAERLGGVPIETKHVVKLIHELRNELAQFWDDAIEGKDWAMKLVEWRAGLGYRLSTPPAKLHLHLIMDLSRCKTIRLPWRDGIIEL